MSRRASYNYAVDNAAHLAARALRQAEYQRRQAERERRRVEWVQRTSETTSGHLARYQAILDDIREQDLVEFVSTEFHEISRLVAQARSLTVSDPAAARDISRQIGPRLGPLPRTARQLRGQRRAGETPAHRRVGTEYGREAAATAQATPATDQPATPVENPAEVAWRESLAGWTDFLARDLAFGDLTALRQRIANPESAFDAAEVKAQVKALKDKWVGKPRNSDGKKPNLPVSKNSLPRSRPKLRTWRRSKMKRRTLNQYVVRP